MINNNNNKNKKKIERKVVWMVARSEMETDNKVQFTSAFCFQYDPSV